VPALESGLERPTATPARRATEASLAVPIYPCDRGSILR
jgi:hypothetical protein